MHGSKCWVRTVHRVYFYTLRVLSPFLTPHPPPPWALTEHSSYYQKEGADKARLSAAVSFCRRFRDSWRVWALFIFKCVANWCFIAEIGGWSGQTRRSNGDFDSPLGSVVRGSDFTVHGIRKCGSHWESNLLSFLFWTTTGKIPKLCNLNINVVIAVWKLCWSAM